MKLKKASVVVLAVSLASFLVIAGFAWACLGAITPRLNLAPAEAAQSEPITVTGNDLVPGTIDLWWYTVDSVPVQRIEQGVGVGSNGAFTYVMPVPEAHRGYIVGLQEGKDAVNASFTVPSLAPVIAQPDFEEVGQGSRSRTRGNSSAAGDLQAALEETAILEADPAAAAQAGQVVSPVLGAQGAAAAISEQPALSAPAQPGRPATLAQSVKRASRDIWSGLAKGPSPVYGLTNLPAASSGGVSTGFALGGLLAVGIMALSLGLHGGRAPAKASAGFRLSTQS